MFTPQSKVWSSVFSSPRIGGDLRKQGGSGDPSGSEKKGVENGNVPDLLAGDERLEGAVDDEVVARLEQELLEYQYNMGLLLIEKQEWSLKLEEVTQALAEAKDALERERSEYLVAISDFDKREEKLRQALGVEKQCVHELEKALHEMRSKYAEIKFTSDSKLAEANALVSSVEEKSLEVEAKLRAADANLAEVCRKSGEIERKLLEADAREDALRREYTNFNNEREAHELTLSKRREDLQEWQNKLKAGEEMLSEGCAILNQREERANEKDEILKQKELDLNEAQTKLDSAKVALKAEEDDVMQRLKNLSSKEKELNAVRHSLEIKEKDLLAFNKKLNHREKVHIDELTNEHNKLLEAKKCELDSEMDQKRQSIEDDLKRKISELEKKEATINHMEEKLAKKEQGLEKRLEKLREKEIEYEAKFKALKDRENSVQLEEKNVEKERVELHAYKAALQNEKDELEKKKAEVHEQQLKLREQTEKLSIAEEERSEFLRLQAELKHEIHQCRMQKELVLKESEDLRHQRDIFERDWEELDKKKSVVDAEIINFRDQKEKFEKLRYSEEEKLREERLANEEYIRNELAALETAKESYAATMEHDKLAASERIENEKSQLLREFVLKQQEIENDMQRKREEVENGLREKENRFNENKEREEKNLNYLREATQQEMEILKLERIRLDKEKQEVSENQKNLEINQLEMHKDINELVSLSSKMKIQREQFLRERERFISFVEKHRSCEKCGEIISEFVLSDLEPVPEGLSDSKLAEQYLRDGKHDTYTGKTNVVTTPVAASGSPASAGTASWLRKCTSKILWLSPIKIVKPEAQVPKEAFESADHGSPSKTITKIGTEPSNDSAKHNLEAEQLKDDPQTQNTEQVRQENAQSTQNGLCKAGKKRRPKITRTRSVKAVVEDAKSFIGERFENCVINTENSLMVSESHGESSLADETLSRNGRKRARKMTSNISSTEVDDNDESEGHSNSLASRKKKRRQKATPSAQAPAPTGNRYNLRRPRAASSYGQHNIENGKREAGKVSGGDIYKLKATPVSSFGSIRNDDGCTPNFQFQTNVDGNANKENMVETTVLSEEANGSVGIASQSMQNETTPKGSLLVDEGSSSDEDEEESENPGEVSIGKKLWTFFTT